MGASAVVVGVVTGVGEAAGLAGRLVSAPAPGTDLGRGRAFAVHEILVGFAVLATVRR